MCEFCGVILLGFGLKLEKVDFLKLITHILSMCRFEVRFQKDKHYGTNSVYVSKKLRFTSTTEVRVFISSQFMTEIF